MSPPREVHNIDTLLEHLPLSPAPEGTWGAVREELSRPEPFVRTLAPGHPIVSGLLATAALVAAVLLGGTVGLVRGYQAPARWNVSTVAGVPTVAGQSLTRSGTLAAGEWLVTDSVSSASLGIGGIGRAEVGPNSRVRLDSGKGAQHRLTLTQGSMYAFVDAPPRLFLIETPTALVTDLGCAYVLEVDEHGVTSIWVTSGWVELQKGARVSLVSAGLVAEVAIDGAPGTPYPRLMSEAGRDALRRLDRGSNDTADLEAAVDAMYPAGLPAPALQPTTITLWHLLQRLSAEPRVRAFEALADISPPPPGVTREGILALDRPMLERWRRDLVPTWSEESVPLLDRVARRLWEWTTRGERAAPAI